MEIPFAQICSMLCQFVNTINKYIRTFCIQDYQATKYLLYTKDRSTSYRMATLCWAETFIFYMACMATHG